MGSKLLHRCIKSNHGIVVYYLYKRTHQNRPVIDCLDIREYVNRVGGEGGGEAEGRWLRPSLCYLLVSNHIHPSGQANTENEVRL